MDKLTLLPLTEQDVKQVLRLESERFPLAPYSEDGVRICLKSPTEKALVLWLNDKIVGYIMFSVTEYEGEIFRLAVFKEYEGHHYGTMLLEAAHKYMQDLKIPVSFLEVRKSNQRAIGLYTKAGYELYRVRKCYYSNMEDANCMKKGL